MTIVVGLLFIVVSQYVQISTAQLSPFYWHNYHQHFELPPTDKAYATRVVQTKWFHHQQLDHFNATDTRQWNQRYFVNAQLHKPGGPVFLHISGESASDPNMMVYGQWYKWAKEHHALMLQLEHRYYGKSRPTEDTSTENLKFLSSTQALADLATFIDHINVKHQLPAATTKWIAFGGSYAGSLAAWLRLKYPRVVHGAVSSSGPLLALADFTQYFQVVHDVLAASSAACVDAVSESFQQIGRLLGDLSGQRELTARLRLCTPLEESVDNAHDFASLYETLASYFAVSVQYNHKWGRMRMHVNEVCDIMLNEALGTPLQRMAAMIFDDKWRFGKDCLSYIYAPYVEYLRQTKWNSGRLWLYQKCTEFGFGHTSNSTEARYMFDGNHMPVRGLYELCVDVFGPKFNATGLNAAVARTNVEYGAWELRTTNVIYVHGSADPWHPLGLLHSPNAAMPVVLINGTSHCADMHGDAAHDPPQLTAARQRIGAFVREVVKRGGGYIL